MAPDATSLERSCGVAEPATRLSGAAERLRETVGLALALPERAGSEGAAASARTRLGEEAFAAGRAAGARAEVEAVLASAAAGPDVQDVAGPTPREVEVLRPLVAGGSNPQVAAALFVGTRTAATHVASILAKLGAESRVEAAARAVRDGLA